MLRRFCRGVITIQMALAVVSCGGSSQTEDTAKKFLKAWQTHDIKTLTMMTSPDVVIDLGMGTLVGRDHIVNPVEFSAGANSVLEFNNVVVRGDTVEFEMVERNEIITACDFEALYHYPRLIFENGLLVRKSTVKEIPKFRLYVQRLGVLRAWITRSRPDVMDKITDERGNYIINRETGELMALMARAWQESKLVE